MKKLLTYFFVTLGVMFFCLILVAVWFYITDPLNLKPLLQMMTAESTYESGEVSAETDSVVESGSVRDSVQVREENDRNPALNAQQEASLDAVGIDPASIPSSITSEQEACFVKVLGQTRVNEIKAGDTPTASEFFQATSCF